MCVCQVCSWLTGMCVPVWYHIGDFSSTSDGFSYWEKSLCFSFWLGSIKELCCSQCNMLIQNLQQKLKLSYYSPEWPFTLFQCRGLAELPSEEPAAELHDCGSDVCPAVPATLRSLHRALLRLHADWAVQAPAQLYATSCILWRWTHWTSAG